MMTPAQTVFLFVTGWVLLIGSGVVGWVDDRVGLSDTWVGLSIGMFASSIAAFAMALAHGTTSK